MKDNKEYVQVNLKIDKFHGEMLEVLREYYIKNFGMIGHNKEMITRLIYREFRTILEYDEESIMKLVDGESHPHLDNFLRYILNEDELEQSWRIKK